MSKDRTCAERIAAHRKGREDDLGALFAILNGERRDYEGDEIDAEQAQETIDQFALDVSTYRVMRVDLSTGGPADYLTVKLFKGPGGFEVENVVYHFADWFDHAEEPVGEDSPLYTYAQQLAEYITDGDES